MASMLENIRSLLTPEILSRVTAQLGEPESAVAKGFGAAIPTIAGMIANQSDDRGFMKDLADLAGRTAADPTAIPSAAGTAFSANDFGTMKESDNWLSNLFGSNLSGLCDSLAHYAGIRGSSAATLLSSAAPLVLTDLGRWMRRDNLSVSGLTDALRSRRSEIAAALPADFELPPGLRATFTVPRAAGQDIRQPAARYITPETDAGLNVPALVLLGVLGVAGLLWWGVRTYHEHAQASIARGMSTIVGTTGTTDGMITRTLPGNVNVSFTPGSIEDALSSYLASPLKGSAAFEFNSIGFETDSATLTAPSRDQLRNVADILNAYPRVTARVEGFTDNVGDEKENLALSRSRAESVAGALVSDGVAEGRVQAEGFGSQKPIASNATEFGRSQNRRVMLEVVAR